MAGSGGLAQEQPRAPFPDFQAKRIRPPAAGTQKRITVQIAPSAQDSGTTSPSAPEAQAPSAGAETRFGWFWEDVGSDLDGASPGRLVDGLAVLEQHGDVPVPRLQEFHEMIGAYGVSLLTSTIGTDVSPALVLAVMAVESHGDANAVSRVGAEGVMQLMPDTAARFGVEDAFDPDQNIKGAVRFLDVLMKEFSGDPVLVLAGYNAGAGAVRDHGGVPPFAETRDYVPKVLAAYQIARNLCVTPPIMISDGCVFQPMR
ncbi:lytic transglycosylase domain-containing protein [Phaeobacter sp. HF9A]|uniref:lytic transglycosylase domain-containing protein n=1 Tax=Phaeobacter sp. HF9A TaxID=2721561 RepID=UPI0020CA4547|nr:lytic transglycosylase domain-containing protein [Phaeobacter sp. HF9A]